MQAISGQIPFMHADSSQLKNPASLSRVNEDHVYQVLRYLDLYRCQADSFYLVGLFIYLCIHMLLKCILRLYAENIYILFGLGQCYFQKQMVTTDKLELASVYQSLFMVTISRFNRQGNRTQ